MEPVPKVDCSEHRSGLPGAGSIGDPICKAYVVEIDSKMLQMKSLNRSLKLINFSTLAGVFSIILWSTTIAFSRIVMEKLGCFNAGFYIFIFSGAFGFLLLIIKYKKDLFNIISKFPVQYYWKVGLFWVVNQVFLLLAIGLAVGPKEVVVVGIINYLWVGLIFFFSIFVLKNKVKKIPMSSGLLIATSGTIIAILAGNGLKAYQILPVLKSNLLPYSLAFITAISWGLYSNLTKKFKTDNDDVALPFLFIVSALLIFGIILLRNELPLIDFKDIKYGVVLQFSFVVIGPSTLAYKFWDIAMKKGNKNLVNSLAYFIPLASTLISSIVLRIKIDIYFGLAAIMIMLGAWLCKKSIIETN